MKSVRIYKRRDVIEAHKACCPYRRERIEIKPNVFILRENTLCPGKNECDGDCFYVKNFKANLKGKEVC